ncbi:MAG: 3',5'-cyclic AMP phosphodiesterase CpdA [Roseivirga sp.]|jgi:3',5'-cyclic AMP phosphodiesterase CpdA
MKKLQNLWTAFVLTLFISSCGNQSNVKAPFEHGIDAGPTPWNSISFNDDPEQFTFAIISDLNGGEREGIFSIAVEQINMLHPEFVLSVGDLIDGGTEDKAQLEKEWESFDNRAAKFNSPFFHLGGNHDLTNVVMREFWQNRYGPRYYHFKYKNILFLMMDSEDYEEERMQEIYIARAKAIEIMDGPNPELYPETAYYSMEERKTGEVSNAQNEYFEKVLAENQDVDWTFVFMHKPVWMRPTGNNLDRLESALGSSAYTVINGHVHDYSYKERNNRDYLTLGTTGGSQNPNGKGAYDHITLVTMKKGEPSIINLKMEGMLNEHGSIPLNGDSLKFHAY